MLSARPFQAINFAASLQQACRGAELVPNQVQVLLQARDLSIPEIGAVEDRHHVKESQ